MISPEAQAGCHSAEVRIQLRVNGQTFKVRQLGPASIMLEGARNHPPSNGQLTMSIDGHTTTWAVFLPDGIDPTQLETRIA